MLLLIAIDCYYLLMAFGKKPLSPKIPTCTTGGNHCLVFVGGRNVEAGRVQQVGRRRGESIKFPPWFHPLHNQNQYITFEIQQLCVKYFTIVLVTLLICCCNMSSPLSVVVKITGRTVTSFIHADVLWLIFFLTLV